MEEQILLCTLLPFRGYDTLACGPFVESQHQIQVVWRTNEIRFTDTESRSITISIEDFAEKTWINLLGIHYCKLSPIYNSLKFLVGIRLYLIKELIMEAHDRSSLCNANFLAFEYSLSECLRHNLYTIELKSQKKKSPDLLPKVIDLDTCLTLNKEAGLHWCFLDLTFKTGAHRTKQVTLRPTFLVSTMTNHWRESLLDQLSKVDNMLIITRKPELWPKECVPISSNGMTFEQTSQKKIFIITPMLVNRNLEKRLELLDLVSSTSSAASNVFVSRSSQQTRRLLIDLSKKFPSFKMPLDFHTFGAVVLDNFNTLDAIDMLPSSLTNRWINVAHTSKHAKPTQLSYRQLQHCARGESAGLLPLLFARSESFLTIIPVPKQVLRRYRIFGHLVRNAPVEDRILKLFPNGCPISPDDAIQRFSGKPMPTRIASEYIARHFSTLGSSLGEYSLPLGSPITQISVHFVVESMKQLPRECAICFEKLTDSFRFTICGHIYCKDCTSVFFKPEWSQGKTKECAMCRLHLLTADVFAIESFDDDFVMQLGSKAQCIQNFLGSTKSRCSFWPEVTESKNIIVRFLGSCFADEIVKHSGPLNIHVFYTSEETKEFLELQNNFL